MFLNNRFFKKWKLWLDSLGGQEVFINDKKQKIAETVSFSGNNYLILGETVEKIRIEVAAYEAKGFWSQLKKAWTTDILAKQQALQYCEHLKLYHQKIREIFLETAGKMPKNVFIEDLSAQTEVGLQEALIIFTATDTRLGKRGFIEKYWPSWYRHRLAANEEEKVIFSQFFSENTSVLINDRIRIAEKQIGYENEKLVTEIFTQFVSANIYRVCLKQWSENSVKIQELKQKNRDLLSQLQSLNPDLGDSNLLATQTRVQLSQLSNDLNNFREVSRRLLLSTQSDSVDQNRTMISLLKAPDAMKENCNELGGKAKVWKATNDDAIRELTVNHLSWKSSSVNYLEKRQQDLQKTVNNLQHKGAVQALEISKLPTSKQLLEKSSPSEEFSFGKSMYNLWQSLCCFFSKPRVTSQSPTTEKVQDIGSIITPGLTKIYDE